MASACATALLVGLLGWCAIDIGCGTLDRIHAEQYSLERDPRTIADAVLAYIKEEGHPPNTVWECIVLAEQDGTALRKYGLAEIRLLNDRNVVMLPFLDRVTLSFPSSPDVLDLRDGFLVTREGGHPAVLLSMRGADETILREANAYLWRNWMLLSDGQKTGQRWLDSHSPAETTRPSEAGE